MGTISFTSRVMGTSVILSATRLMGTIRVASRVMGTCGLFSQGFAVSDN